MLKSQISIIPAFFFFFNLLDLKTNTEETLWKSFRSVCLGRNPQMINSGFSFCEKQKKKVDPVVIR